MNRNFAQQNAERRLRHNRWEREPACGAACYFIIAMFVAAFIVPLVMAS